MLLSFHETQTECLWPGNRQSQSVQQQPHTPTLYCLHERWSSRSLRRHLQGALGAGSSPRARVWAKTQGGHCTDLEEKELKLSAGRSHGLGKNLSSEIREAYIQIPAHLCLAVWQRASHLTSLSFSFSINWGTGIIWPIALLCMMNTSQVGEGSEERKFLAAK